MGVMLDFDPDTFVDREHARRRFQDLLEFRDERRLMVVVAPGGAGKSGLLLRFWWSCVYPDQGNGERERPVSHIPLDESGGGRVVDVVRQVRGDLPRLDWAQFEEVHNRWLGYDMRLFGQGPLARLGESTGVRMAGAPVAGIIDARGANVSRSTLTGVNIERVEHLTVDGGPGWPTSSHEAEANRIYVREFCAAIKRNADRGPVVLIFDGYDHATPDLRAWVQRFVHDHCIDHAQRPAYLAVVLACRELAPGMRANLRGRPVEVIERFEDWTDDLVMRFLEAKGLPDPTPAEIELVREDLNAGRLQDAVQFINLRKLRRAS